MSKWLKKGFGQHNASNTSTNNYPEQYPETQQQAPPSDMAPGATTAQSHYASPPPQSNMTAYGTSNPGGMDIVDNPNYHERNNKAPSSHYQSSQRHQVPVGMKGTAYAHETSSSRSRSARTRPVSGQANGDDPGEGSNGRHRSRSNRSSDDSRRSRGSSANRRSHHKHSNGSSGHYQYSSPQHGSHPTGSGNGAPPQHHHYHGHASQHAPPHYDGDAQNNSAVTPSPPADGASIPSFSSAPGATSQQGQTTQRRPAYLLHRDLVIGKGSYGQVCIASRGEAEGHLSSGGRGGSGKRRKFACKCVVLRNDPKYIAKLQEEVNVLRELRGHENVIRLYDVFCVDNELFIITELGRGGDLFHLLTTHPKHGVTEAYAAKTVAQMLSAVAFLHSRNICHRDLKLENWVLESGKDVWSPLKLIDFGLSTHFTPGHRLARVVGSSYYVAPEVLKKSYTEACDLWSLGVIVYMLLSGAPPFYGKNDEAIKASIVQGEYTFPHELFRDVSDEAMAFVSTLLSYNIEYRYTAEQALTHPWLAANLDPEQLQRARDGARGVGAAFNSDMGRPEPMQM